MPDRVALVTGGSRGIGAAVAERLARDGAAIAVGYRSRDDDARQVVEACRSAGGEAVAVRADLAEMHGVTTLFDQVMARFGRLNILINNAAAASGLATFDAATEELYDETFATNTKAVFFAIQLAARRMADGGRIVNLSTINASIGSPETAAYAGSKAAIEAFTRVAAKELGARGITVNAVQPGTTDTEMLRALNSPQALEQAAAMSPFQRLGQPTDIADVIAWLVSDDARWVTGQVIRADGGLLP